MIDFFDYSNLCLEVTKWAKAYDDGNPIVSDPTYDDAYRKLKQFELANPTMIDKHSPTQGVVAGITDGFPKRTHEVPMISIANSMSHDELRAFCDDRTKKGCAEKVIEFKIDGAALGLMYNNGELQDAITRGDGVTGDSVFANALQISAIPKRISVKHKVEIRGECVWMVDKFQAYNDRMEKIGGKIMANPRNSCAGTIKSKDPQEVADRELSFIAYSVVQGSSNDKHSEDMEWLKNEGFITSEYYICPNTEKVIDGAIYMEKKRYTLPFLIDGLVIKVNDKTAYKRLGGTSKTPHAFSALKFKAEEKVTKLLDIEHSYGRSGACTPVAIVEEIELALTKVRRASLHNWDIVSYLCPYKGCSVVIRKAAEIIPEIVKVDGIDGRSKDDYEVFMSAGGDLKASVTQFHAEHKKDWYLRPTKCAHCGSDLQNDTNRAGDKLISWICANPACPIKQFKNIVKFVSKEAMNIMGVGESVIEELLSKGYIKDITDLYKLDKSQLLTLDGFGSRAADKFLTAINISRNNYMHQFLAGVGISNLGRMASNTLAEHFGDLERFHQAPKEELESIPGIGHELAGNIADFRKDGSNRHLFRWFIDNNICTKAKPVKKASNKLKDMVFIMTGKFDGLDRSIFKDLVVEHGGKISSGITSKVNYVLVGDGAGPSKLNKISDLKKEGVDIKTITDKEFLKMID